jgi:hypothetical protein
MTENGNKAGTNPGYALFQLAKALTTSESHADADTRERAQQKITNWMKVLRGMFSGAIDVGSRTPVKQVPGWATLEVVTGGFATGGLLAGGPLREHEQALLASLPSSLTSGPHPANEPLTAGTSPRQVLNSYYLTEEGLARLQEMVRSGYYDIAVPEEGALLVVAWLVRSGYAEEARTLLDELVPYLADLRFYPIPTPAPRRSTAGVFLQDAGTTIETLRQIKPNQPILAQKEAVHVWIPLYDQMAALFLETVDGVPPTLRHGPDGTLLRTDDGRFLIEGDWPCQQYPDGWQARACTLLDQISAARQTHRLCGKPDQKDGNFAYLRAYLSRCTEDPASLSGYDVGKIRMLLASYVAKYGRLGATPHQEFRSRQVRQASRSAFTDIARVVVQRLEAYPADGGVDDLHSVTRTVTAAEAERWQVPAGTPIPESLCRKVRRCLSASVDTLVSSGLITSGETLARVLPQVTADLRANGLADDDARRLYAAIYRAFRRRRSLLLLNLESQVKLHELPWVAALDRHRSDSLTTREVARQALLEMTTLALGSFPYAILPNKLLQEFRPLAVGAGLALPLVDELAADIFMGEFSDKFLDAAKRAADLLEGTLYASYYGIDCELVRQLPNRAAFADLCRGRAGVGQGSWSPATNGMIIEQQQILTTQNLAVLFAGLDLKSVLGSRLDALDNQLDRMARTCFHYVWRLQHEKIDRWHDRQIMQKQTAYAWRQMLFYLSLLPGSEVALFLRWVATHKPTGEVGERFGPVMQGLVLAAAGHSPDDPAAGARRLLGWSQRRD